MSKRKPVQATQDTLFDLDIGTFQPGDILRNKETGDLCRLHPSGGLCAYIEYLTGEKATCRDDPYWNVIKSALANIFELASEQEIAALAQGNQESEKQHV